MRWPEASAPARRDPWTAEQRAVMSERAMEIARAVKAGASLKLMTASGKWFHVVVKGHELPAPMGVK